MGYICFPPLFVEVEKAMDDLLFLTKKVTIDKRNGED